MLLSNEFVNRKIFSGEKYSEKLVLIVARVKRHFTEQFNLTVA